jgi:Protein of unknown function with HXXEE motif
MEWYRFGAETPRAEFYRSDSSSVRGVCLARRLSLDLQRSINAETERPACPPDRYPLNQNNAAFINVLAWVFYLVPVLLPGVIWLGTGQMLFGLVGQVIVHGVIINSKLKTWYNPGLVAVILGHVPLAILYFLEVFNRSAGRWWDLIFGILYLGFFAGVIMQRFALGGPLASPNSRYPFATEEMNRNDREGRLRRAGIEPRAF